MKSVRKNEDRYDDEFYAEQFLGSLRSARRVFRELVTFYRPRSVVDFGCGRGAWLRAAAECGASDLAGYDGPWLSPQDLVVESVYFTTADMERSIEIERRYDLAISVEVAEHLSPNRAQGFVADLCKASDIVLFSAAIPGQGGTNHVNEQWPSYWVGLFRAGGYDCFDVLRPALWSDSEVEFWYRQNILLFVRTGASLPLDRPELERRQRPIIDAVHPALLEIARRPLREPSLWTVLSVAKRWMLRRDRPTT